MSIRHSYSDPIWMSDWLFDKNIVGTRHTDFCNRFDNEHMYSEVDEDDIDNIKTYIAGLGNIYRDSDRRAYEETMRVIEFCEKWLKKPDVILIFQSEF
jgi:hypothetical protein